jgi:hypothetical protein
VGKTGEAAVVKHVASEGPPDSPMVLDGAARHDELLKNPWEPVEIVVHDPHWLIVPGEFVPAGSEEKYLAALYGPALRPVFRDFIRPLKLCVIYSVDEELVRKCTYYFRQPKLKHALTSFLLFHRQIHKNPKTPFTATIASLNTRLLYIVFKGQDPLFANFFPIAGPEDVVYYVKTVNQTLGVDTWNYYFHGADPATFRFFESFFPGLSVTGAEFFSRFTDTRARKFAQEFGYLFAAP